MSHVATKDLQEKIAALMGGLGVEAVAAGSANVVLGAAGAIGDTVSHLVIVPATTSPGAVSIKDGAGSAITVFAGGANSVSSLVPFAVPLGADSKTGAWSVTTGANVSVVAFGRFS
jgi:hypothetical protein